MPDNKSQQVVRDKAGSDEQGKSGSDKTGSQAPVEGQLSQALQDKFGVKTYEEALLKSLETNATLTGQLENSQRIIGQHSREVATARQPKAEYTEDQRTALGDMATGGKMPELLDGWMSATESQNRATETAMLGNFYDLRASDPQYANMDFTEVKFNALKQGSSDVLIDAGIMKSVMDGIIKGRPVDVDAIRKEAEEKVRGEYDGLLKEKGVSIQSLKSTSGDEPIVADDTPLADNEEQERDMISFKIGDFNAKGDIEGRTKFLATIPAEKRKRYGIDK